MLNRLRHHPDHLFNILFQRPLLLSKVLQGHRGDAFSTSKPASFFFTDAKLRSKVFSRSLNSSFSTYVLRIRASMGKKCSSAFATDVTNFATSFLVTAISSSTSFSDASSVPRLSINCRASRQSCGGRAASVAKPCKVCSSKFLLYESFVEEVIRSWRSLHSATCGSTVTLRSSS